MRARTRSSTLAAQVAKQIPSCLCDQDSNAGTKSCLGARRSTPACQVSFVWQAHPKCRFTVVGSDQLLTKGEGIE
jgi:hypothetical protein